MGADLRPTMIRRANSDSATLCVDRDRPTRPPPCATRHCVIRCRYGLSQVKDYSDNLLVVIHVHRVF